MIEVTLLGKAGQAIFLNPYLVETIVCLPDTVITLTDGHVYRVVETPEEVVSRITAYRQKACAGPV